MHKGNMFNNLHELNLGILGGGQLGRMMINAANRLGINIVILDPQGNNSPAGKICKNVIKGDYKNENDIKKLSEYCDIITTEIEHVDVDALYKLVSKNFPVHPNPHTIEIIQNKYLQKSFFDINTNVPLGMFMEINNKQDAYSAGKYYGYPYMLKCKKLAYDGKGNIVINSSDDIDKVNNINDKIYYAEKFVLFKKELAVMVVNNNYGISSYPVVETIQRNSVCNVVICPAQINERLYNMAKNIAIELVEKLPGESNYGVFGVELFVVDINGTDTIMLNEIAPRPHNSGHYTIDACIMDQFEAHVRSVLYLPINEESLKLKVKCACMINILGTDNNIDTDTNILSNIISDPECICNIHWYGKTESRKGRKLGHITVTSDDYTKLYNMVEKICGTDNRELNNVPHEQLVNISNIISL